MKILVLKSDEDDFENYYINGLKKEEIDVCPVYKKRGKWSRYIAIILLQYLKIPYQSWNYESWKRTIKEYDMVIVFDRIWSFSILKYIRKKNPTCKLIFWYWNKVNHMVPDSIRKCCEVWSFDEEDCLKYNMKKNTQFYIPAKETEISRIEQDVYFIGKEKNRLRDILDVVQQLKEKNIDVKCEILSNNLSVPENLRIDAPRTYNEIIEEIKKSKCILDIGITEQSGITLRVLEALFYQKKLITNNINVLKLPFYCTNNIFILGKDDIENIKQFIEGKYDESYKQFINLYTVKKWIQNFIE